MAYSYEDDNYHTPDYWRLARSTDGGKTFSVIYDGVGDGSIIVPPAIETDAAGNVYVIAPTRQDGILQGPTLFYRFSPTDNYTTPTVHRLAIGGAGKYSTVYDPTRHVIDLLFWAFGSLHPNFFSITPTGTVLAKVKLFDPATANHAQPEYPIMTIASDGTIFAGWSTLDTVLWDNGSGTQNYYDAHFLASTDGGQTWLGPKGSVALPVQGDSTGSSFEIVNTNDPVQFVPWHTPQYAGDWNLLQTMAFNKGSLSFFYGGPLPQPHDAYARMDWSTRSFVQRMSPYFGPTDGAIAIADRGGSFSQSPDDSGRLYFSGLTLQNGEYRLVRMYSDDGGSTWYLDAEGNDNWAGMGVNYINTFRYLDADGSVIGMFESNPSPGAPSTIYFFRIGEVSASGTG